MNLNLKLEHVQVQDSKIQLELNDTFRGRVMSVWVMINMGSAALGTIIFGFVSDYLTIQMTQVVFGYIFIILIVFLISINKITSNSSILWKWINYNEKKRE